MFYTLSHIALQSHLLGVNRKPNLIYRSLSFLPTFLSQSPGGGGGGGGGMSHWGLYIMRVNHSLKGTLNEDEATVLNTTLRMRTGYLSQICYPFRGSCADLSRRSVNLIPCFSYFPVFDTLNAITRGVVNLIPFSRVFVDADDVQAPMTHAPPGLSPFPDPFLLSHSVFTS